MKNKDVPYICPIILKNKRFTPFKFDQNILIRRMTSKERREFFGLDGIKFVFSSKFPFGYIAIYETSSSKRSKGRYSHKELMHRGFFDGVSDILAANYVISLNVKSLFTFSDLVDDINLSFSLFKPTSTGIYLGFAEKETGVSFYHKIVIHGPFDYLYVSRKDLLQIKRIFNLVRKKRADNKFRLWSELYTRALQGGRLDLDLRFLSLLTCLESLFLPDTNHELSFKLSLRIAKVFEKYKYGKCEDVYKMVKTIYTVRSKILHSGKYEKLEPKLFYETVEIVRKSLNLYLKFSDAFSEGNLNKIVCV